MDWIFILGSLKGTTNFFVTAEVLLYSRITEVLFHKEEVHWRWGICLTGCILTHHCSARNTTDLIEGYTDLPSLTPPAGEYKKIISDVNGLTASTEKACSKLNWFKWAYDWKHCNLELHSFFLLSLVYLSAVSPTNTAEQRDLGFSHNAYDC